MPKYRVEITYRVTVWKDIEAADQDDAMEKAFELSLPNCHLGEEQIEAIDIISEEP